MPEQADIAIHDQLSFLKRRYRTRLRYARGVVSAVPLADLVLILLLFVIMNSWHVLKPGVYVDLPESPFVSGVRSDAMVVTICREGFVFFDDERTTVEGLRERMVRAAAVRPGISIIIEADQRVDHGTILRIFSMAMDAGVEEVAMATRGISEMPENGP